MMKVTVEVITGTYMDNEMSENATVRNLKEKIAADLKLPAKRLILLVGENERRRIVTDCEDEILLVELGVREDSHVYLFFKHLDLISRAERNRGGGDYAPMEDNLTEAEIIKEEIDGEDDNMEAHKEKESGAEAAESKEKEERIDDQGVEEESKDEAKCVKEENESNEMEVEVKIGNEDADEDVGEGI